MRIVTKYYLTTLCVLCAFILNGCYTAISTRSSIYRYSNYYYTPNILDINTIDTPVYIEVVLDQIDLDLFEGYIINELDEKIKNSFINELETVFLNVVCEPEESQIQLKVTVNQLKASSRITFINYFPFVRVGVFLLGGPVFINRGLAEVTVSAYKSDKSSLINSYTALSKASGLTGFYYGKDYFDPCNDSYVTYMASSKAMDDIKTKILYNKEMLIFSNTR